MDDVTLTVDRGDVYGLLGPNGAGKTTFIRMLFGLIRPDAGGFEIFGRPFAADGIAALADVAGFVETPRFYPYLSGRSNLELLARLDGRGARRRIDDVLDVVGLTSRARSKVGEYSYGMVQRLGVASALMRDPALLVLDEPTNGLDPAGIRDMRELVRTLAGTGLTVLLSSHNMLEVEALCQRVAIMRRGGIAFDGSVADLRARATDVEYRLQTTDDIAAGRVCDASPSVSHVRADREGVSFDAHESGVEHLSLALAESGIGIRTLFAPTSALETLFFRLTEDAEDERSTRTDDNHTEFSR